MSLRFPSTRAPEDGEVRLHASSAIGVVLVGLVVMGLAAASGISSRQEVPFSHERHAGLFPVCTGCHVQADGVGDPGYPPPTQCAQCHDGADLPEVGWAGPRVEASNLTFTHATHAAELSARGEPSQSCEACHSAPGAERMRVEGRVQEGTCFSCHLDDDQDHFSGPPSGAASCTVCHVPLAASSFSMSRIAGLPVPADHEKAGFLASGHGAAASVETARCATCHTEDRCLACHVDAGNPVIAAVPVAPPDMELPPATSAYPVPESHRTAAWAVEHATVTGTEGCVTCHTSNDCRSCHVAPTPAVVEALPRREEVRAPGVGLTPSAPGTHASPFFMEAHTTLAAADEGTCATCHTERYCADCHDAPAGASYHPTGFVGTHAATAFGRADECASCHETAVFCRSCHIESGLGSTGRLGAGYHDAEPVWLLRHGQAARQNLESCASCHEQRDCVQCHGVLGSFKVSPHQPGFDAAGAWARSPRTCLACHVGNPLGGA